MRLIQVLCQKNSFKTLGVGLSYMKRTGEGQLLPKIEYMGVLYPNRYLWVSGMGKGVPFSGWRYVKGVPFSGWRYVNGSWFSKIFSM